MSSIVELGASALSSAIHRREISCVEVMDAYLRQISALNATVNALVAMQPEDALRRAASDADTALRQHGSAGWLHGFPLAPKDLAAVAGLVTTKGSSIYRNQVPKEDSLVVSRLRRAGAIFIGRSNTPEFGFGSHTYNSVYGLTRNAFDQDVSAGGSSGGAAVAVALRMLPVADGTDMMGSLRNPAAWNNVFGFRPSYGRVPTWPVADVYLAQYSTAGAIGRSVADLAMMLSVQAGFDVRVPSSLREPPSLFTTPLDCDLRGARIGWLGDLGGHLPMQPGVLPLCEKALEPFASMGCEIAAVTPDFSLEALWHAWQTLRSFYAACSYQDLYRDEALRAQLKPEAIWEIERGLAVTAQEVYQANVTRTAWFQEVTRLFKTFDYLVLPSAQVFPFDARLHWPGEIAGRRMTTYHQWMEVAIPVTLAGLPALSVPAGFSAEGLPMGMQLIGRPQGDLGVLQLAHAYEQATRHHSRRSPLLA